MPMVTIMRAERPASSRFGKPRFLYSHRKARPEDVLEKALEQGGHRSMPKRKQKDPVLCSAHVLPGLLQARRQRPGLEIPLRPQQRELKLGHFYPPYLVFRCRRRKRQPWRAGGGAWPGPDGPGQSQCAWSSAALRKIPTHAIECLLALMTASTKLRLWAPLAEQRCRRRTQRAVLCLSEQGNR